MELDLAYCSNVAMASDDNGDGVSFLDNDGNGCKSCKTFVTLFKLGLCESLVLLLYSDNNFM